MIIILNKKKFNSMEKLYLYIIIIYIKRKLFYITKNYRYVTI